MWILFTLVRIIGPLSLFYFPFWGGIFSIILDAWDWKFLPLHSSQDYALYQQWDKFLDIFYLTLEALLVFFWRNKVVRNVGLSLFAFRMLGIILFEITHLRSLLFFFPNTFELYYLYIAAYMGITKDVVVSFSQKYLVLLVAVLTLPKLAQEYFFHISPAVPWQIIDIGQMLGSSNVLYEYIGQSMWLLLYVSLPLGLLWLKVKHDKPDALKL